jgi:hypothetical protein
MAINRQNYAGVEYESDEELYVLYWLEELRDKGFIISIERAPEIKLSDGLLVKYNKITKLKTKEKVELKDQILLQPHYYTPEFKVKWAFNVPNKLLWNLNSVRMGTKNSVLIGHPPTHGIFSDPAVASITYIEVKPDFDQNNMTREFRINQKWAWEARKLYVNLLFPKKLFTSTFTPQAYRLTRVKRTERTIRWEIVTLDQYLAM